MHAVRAKITEYLVVVRWFAIDALWTFRGTTFAIVLGGILALLCEVQAIALAVYYGHALADDRTLDLFAFEWDARTSVIGLCIAGAAVMASMLVASLVRYASRLAVLRLRGRYAKHCWYRILRLAPHLPWRRSAEGPNDLTTLMRLARTDSMLCSRFAAILAFALLALLRLVLTVTALLVLNPALTLIIAGLAGVTLIIFYRISIRAARYSLEYEESGRPAVDEARESLHGVAHALQSGQPPTPEREDWPAAETFIDKYVGRLRCADDSEFVGNAFLAIVLGATLIGLGWSSIRSGHGWESAAAYVIALPYALLAFRQISRTITMLNRFYPMAKRYRGFLCTLDDPPTATDDPPQLPVVVPTGRAPKPEREDELALHAGEAIALLAPCELNQFTASWIVDQVIGHGDARWRRHTAIATSNAMIDATIFPSLEWSDEDHARLADLADAAGMANPATLIDAEHAPWGAASRFLASLAEARRDPSVLVVLIDAASILRMPSTSRAAIRSVCGDRLVIVVAADDTSGLGLLAEEHGALLRASGAVLFGTVDWIRSRAVRSPAVDAVVELDDELL